MNTSTKRAPFVIPDTGKETTSFEYLHFYQWLTEGNYQTNRMATILAYLKERGFVAGWHRLSPADLTILKATFEHYWYTVKRPVLIQKDKDHAEANWMVARGLTS